MKLEKINIAKTKEYVQAIYSRRIVFSNYFGQAFEKDDKYLETNNTFILAKPVRDFYRIYVASNNRKEIVEVLSGLEETNVINFPTKGDMQEDIKTIMTESGYEQIGVYERYLLNVKDLEYSKEMTTIAFATEQDEEETYNLYSNWKDFNPYTDWLPTKIELKEFIKNKAVIINKQNNRVVGVVICPIVKSLIKWHLLIDLSGGGMKLVNAMFEMAVHNKIKYCQFWVNSRNEKAVKFHRRLGATPDGLKDFTYIKRL